MSLHANPKRKVSEQEDKEGYAFIIFRFWYYRHKNQLFAYFMKDTFSCMSTDTISFTMQGTTSCISDDTTSKTFSVSSHACMLHQYMMIVGSRIIICLWCHWKEAKVPQMVIRLELSCQVMSEPPVEWCRKLHYKFAHWWSMTKCTYGLLKYANLRFCHHSWYNTSIIFLYDPINCNLE